MTIDEIKAQLQGDWQSISTEVRPSAAKNENGSAKPFYLKRTFSYGEDDLFRLAITNFVDPYGKVPLAIIQITGHISWQGPHEAHPDAQKVDFTADVAYEVTPMIQGFTDLLNQVAGPGYEHWETGYPQSVFGKTFIPFGLTAGVNFKEFDLILLSNEMLFWGARHVDGRGFDTPENRPTNLQIPLVRR